LRTRFITLRRVALLAAALSCASAAAGVESATAAWMQVARWEMNEGPTATIMRDSSGHRRTGQIGDLVITGVVVNGDNKAYEWPADPPLKDIGRLVIVDRPAMNPFRNAFSVALRLKTTATEGNILQKGQAKTTGGMWKVELTDGHAICVFKGPAGRAAIGSRRVLAPNEWHSVRCTRRLTGVTIVVDREFPRTTSGRTGNIDNNSPLTIGGKMNCNPDIGVSCQYYVGRLDRVIIKKR
jgi:Laminin G domain